MYKWDLIKERLYKRKYLNNIYKSFSISSFVFSVLRVLYSIFETFYSPFKCVCRTKRLNWLLYFAVSLIANTQIFFSVEAFTRPSVSSVLQFSVIVYFIKVSVLWPKVLLNGIISISVSACIFHLNTFKHLPIVKEPLLVLCKLIL